MFRFVAASYSGTSFEVQFCSDGLITYRHQAHEQAILENWEKAENDISMELTASSVAWPHYIQALNILFALLESALHTNRNMQLYWIAPIARIDVVRLRYNAEGLATSTLAYGPRTEMALQRYSGAESVGARIDGFYHDDVIAAFCETSAVFERAHQDPHLWEFLNRFSTSWTSFHLGMYDSAVVLSWSLIERYLVKKVDALLAMVAEGSVMKQTSTGSSRMSRKEETDLRAKISQGESPMAGILLSVLHAHGERIFQEILATKLARDNIAHGGTSGGSAPAVSGLQACSLIAKETFNVVLNNQSNGNAHLGLTP